MLSLVSSRVPLLAVLRPKRCVVVLSAFVMIVDLPKGAGLGANNWVTSGGPPSRQAAAQLPDWAPRHKAQGCAGGNARVSQGAQLLQHHAAFRISESIELKAAFKPKSAVGGERCLGWLTVDDQPRLAFWRINLEKHAQSEEGAARRLGSRTRPMACRVHAHYTDGA